MGFVCGNPLQKFAGPRNSFGDMVTAFMDLALAGAPVPRYAAVAHVLYRSGSPWRPPWRANHSLRAELCDARNLPHWAASVQQQMEVVVLEELDTVREAVRDVEGVIMAGGTAFNWLLTTALWRRLGKPVHVPSDPGDDGVAAGFLLCRARAAPTPFLGPGLDTGGPRRGDGAPAMRPVRRWRRSWREAPQWRCCRAAMRRGTASWGTGVHAEGRSPGRGGMAAGSVPSGPPRGPVACTCAVNGNNTRGLGMSTPQPPNGTTD